MKTTTIQLEKDIVEDLKNIREYPRQTYNELILHMIKVFKMVKQNNQYDVFLHQIQQVKMKELDHLKEEYSKCTRCPQLVNTRTNVVFGVGDPDKCKVVIIGEAPGADEDTRGLPFVGRSGKLLTDMLAAIKLDRKNDVFITNILKCRPPENRDPGTEEIHQCSSILERQIETLSRCGIQDVVVVRRQRARRSRAADGGQGRRQHRLHALPDPLRRMSRR